MQVDKPCDLLDACYCGGRPTSYRIGYGPRPYDVVCPKCKRQVTDYCDSIGGHHGHIIWLWNKIAYLTPDETHTLAGRQGAAFTRAPDLTIDGKPERMARRV